MDVAALFLHNMRSDPCPGWFVSGDVSDADRERIDAIFAKHIEYEQDAGFNEWHISPAWDDKYFVKRFTWDGLWVVSLDALAGKLAQYY